MTDNPSIPLARTTTTAEGICIVPTIHLTFDDGPSANAGTEVVLDVLRAKSLKATFFLNMKNANDNPARQRKLIQRMVVEGHVVGSHGYEHAKTANKKYYDSKTTSEIKDDFIKNENEMEKLYLAEHDRCPTMEVARLQGDGRFRAPFVGMITSELKIAHAGWNVEFFPNEEFKGRSDRNENWEHLSGVTASFARPIGDHDVVLLHDAHWAGKRDRLSALLSFLSSQFVVKPLNPKFDKACGAVKQPQ